MDTKGRGCVYCDREGYGMGLSHFLLPFHIPINLAKHKTCPFHRITILSIKLFLQSYILINAIFSEWKVDNTSYSFRLIRAKINFSILVFKSSHGILRSKFGLLRWHGHEDNDG
jgi:hypothetical protein